MITVSSMGFKKKFLYLYFSSGWFNASICVFIALTALSVSAWNVESVRSLSPFVVVSFLFVRSA